MNVHPKVVTEVLQYSSQYLGVVVTSISLNDIQELRWFQGS